MIAVAVRERKASILEAHPTEAAWLQARTTGIGASEIGAILGLEGAYSTPYQVWAGKVGLAEDTPGEREALKWGKRLQDAILGGYAEETGREVRSVQHALYRHPEHRWLLASPDGFVREGGQDVAVVEAKNVSEWKREAWEADTPPDLFLVQVQYQLLATGLTWGALAALVGGNRLRHVEILEDADLQAVMLEAGAAFWLRVQREEPPTVDGSERTKKLLGQVFRQPTDQYLSLPPVATSWDQEWLDLRSALSVKEARKGELENLLRAEIGSALGGLLPDGTRWTNTRIETAERTVVYPATEYRRLTRAKAKKNGR